jgi:hypothetical protein
MHDFGEDIGDTRFIMMPKPQNLLPAQPIHFIVLVDPPLSPN